MSFNLMEMVKEAVSDKASAAMAGVLGSDPQAAEGAAGMALPAMIGGLLKKTSSSTGASELFGMLDVYDGSQLDELGDAFDGGAKQADWLSDGKGILETVFGGNMSAIIGRVAKATGMDSSTVGKLFSMLAPIVMGVLGKHKQTAGWDISGFTSAMGEQKGYLAKLDPGLLDSLGLNDMMGSAKQAAGAVTGVASSAASGGMDKATESAGQAGSLLKMLVPLILIAVLAFVAWKFLFSGNSQQPGSKKEPAKIEAPADTGTAVRLRQTLNTAKNAIGNITDEASAQVAADKVKELTPGLDALNLSSLTGARKRTVATAFAAARRPLDRALEKAYKIPGVKPIMEPAIDGLMEKVSSLTN